MCTNINLIGIYPIMFLLIFIAKMLKLNKSNDIMIHLKFYGAGLNEWILFVIEICMVFQNKNTSVKLRDLYKMSIVWLMEGHSCGFFFKNECDNWKLWWTIQNWNWFLNYMLLERICGIGNYISFFFLSIHKQVSNLINTYPSLVLHLSGF
jgi:hypothetical protein